MKEDNWINKANTYLGLGTRLAFLALIIALSLFAYVVIGKIYGWFT